MLINIKAAWAVDRKFFYILWVAWTRVGSLWGALGLPLDPFGRPWPPLGHHLGPFWVLWLPLAVIWVLFGSIWPSLGLPLAFLGLPGCSGFTLGFILRANVAQVPRLRTKSSLGEFASWSRGSRGSRLNGVMKCCSDPPSTRAGGQDDVSSKQTPSN